MKELLRVLVIVLLAVPAFAQDDFGIFDNTISGTQLDALLGGGGRGRGGPGNGIQNLIPDPEQMTNQFKDALKSNDVPLSKDQEKALKEMLTTERQSVEQVITAQFGNRGNNNQNENQNRNNNNNFNPAEIFDQLEKITQKHNTELLAAMNADLTPDQQKLVTKAVKDKKKVCTVMVDVINLKQLEEQQNSSGPGGFGGGGFGGGFGGGGFDGGFGGGFGGGGFPGGFDRGGRGGGRGGFNNLNLPNRPGCTTHDSTTAERLTPLGEVLSKGKHPLTTDQETQFTGLIQDQMGLLEEELAANTQIQNLVDNLNRNDNSTVNPQQLRNSIVSTILQQLGIQTNNFRGNRGGGNRGGNFPGNPNGNNEARGGNGNNANNFNRNRGNNNFNIQAELEQRHEALLDKVIAMLHPDQQPVIKKLKYDEIKQRGGAEEVRGILAEEDTPLTPEQLTKIQQLFDAASQGIQRFTEDIVTKEISKLSPEDLKPPAADSDATPTGNPNNVNQNPRAQQIVGELLPQVSRQNALLQKATKDSVMKVLTPAQVASYKLSSL